MKGVGLALHPAYSPPRCIHFFNWRGWRCFFNEGAGMSCFSFFLPSFLFVFENGETEVRKVGVFSFLIELSKNMVKKWGFLNFFTEVFIGKEIENFIQN